MALLPLGRVKEIVEAAGMDISYAYEDLLFMDHNALLLQFIDSGDGALIHVNSQADYADISTLIDKLKKIAGNSGMIFRTGNYYEIDELEDATIELRFLDHV